MKVKEINKDKKKKSIFRSLFKPKIKVELRKGNLYKITLLDY